ncbi:ATP synthase mitochondrial F1 complex assembly factor 1 [Trypanosoma conorhini]|uniref:ATP synthase mitochondrial F1 complex assembly factor 1 n=1 Tax=Trypanosoma conorhini TaxID=83891 RepID=A0A422PR59_9TRYP|nr:ATP synthase mitochondrial F1 complex assembly factor 1 [Trypanosoma conorhini]RNF20191.1 ATP synthase mitochondrial F1 complex assembly factor 1 [Trypanosoma conorhini]
MLRKSCGLRGFYKLPGRKSLDEICKLSLLEATPTPQVAALWNEHHKQFVQYWGRVISADAYGALRPRLQNCPYFVIPVFRTKGLFNVVTNWDSDLIGVAPLGEWQQKQDHAQIDMTIQFFTELSRTKRIVLVRCEIKDKIFVRQDCVFVTQMLLKYYTQPRLYETWVEVFNKRPHLFDYHMYLRAMKEEARRDDIRIEDKKAHVGLDAYGPVIDTPPDTIAQQILGSVDTGVLQPGGKTTS